MRTGMLYVFLGLLLGACGDDDDETGDGDADADGDTDADGDGDCASFRGTDLFAEPFEDTDFAPRG